MKKVWLMLIVFALLLSGCDLLPFGDREAPTVEPTEETQVTVTEPEETNPWIYEQGRPWDRENILLDVTPAITGGMQYSAVYVFGDDLLLWGYDTHLENAAGLQMCVLELDDGTVRAQRDLVFSKCVTVQILNDRIYLSDCDTGEILVLDENLSTVDTLSTEPMAGDWYMGANGKLYIHDWAGQLWVRDLSTRTTEPWLSDGSSVIYVNRVDDLLLVEYSTYATGAFAYGAVDLNTGGISLLEEGRYYSTAAFSDGNWLCGTYNDFMWYTFYHQDTQPMIVDTNGGFLTFVDGPYLLCTSEEETNVAL